MRKMLRPVSIMLIIAMLLPIACFAASADELDSIMVRYYNENSWSQPYMYTYCGSDEESSWPGTAMDYESDGWYSLTVYGYSTAYVIFSDNGSDQNPAAGETGFEVSGEMWYYKGSLSEEMPDISSITVHYYNENNWSTPYIYYYSDDTQTVSWPGEAMTSEGGNWYYFTISDLAAPKVIFSDNGSDRAG